MPLLRRIPLGKGIFVLEQLLFLWGLFLVIPKSFLFKKPKKFHFYLLISECFYELYIL